MEMKCKKNDKLWDRNKNSEDKKMNEVERQSGWITVDISGRLMLITI